MDKVIERFWSKVRKTDGCWEWTAALNHRGYGIFARKHGENTTAHRFSLELALGRRLEAVELACHHCDNRKCVRPDHLFVGSAADNTRDMMLKGRHRFGIIPPLPGERHPRAKLTDAQVREMRRLRKTGRVPIKDLGRQFGVSWLTAKKIVLGLSWKHLEA